MSTVALPLARPRLPLAAGALGALAAAGVLVALAAASGTDAYLVPALVRARASWLSGPLAPLGLQTSLDGVYVAIGVMTVAYAAAVALAPQVPLAAVLAVAGLLDVAFGCAPPLFSTDLFNYVDIGRIAHSGLDPYSATPAAGPHGGLFVFLHWRHTVTVYGPLFTLLAAAMGGLSVSAALWAHKAIAAAAAFGATLLVARIATGSDVQERAPSPFLRGRSGSRAAVAFGLNPLVLVWTVGGGHNDALMVLGMVGGAALVQARRPALGGAAVVSAAAVKLSAGLALPFVVWRARGVRWAVLVGAALAAAIIGGLALDLFPHASGMFTGLEHQQSLDGLASVATGLGDLFGVTVPSAALHAVLALWLAGCAFAVWRGADPLAVAGWAMLGVLATATWLLPWYLAWPLALGAAAGDARLVTAASVLGLSWAAGHIPLS